MKVITSVAGDYQLVYLTASMHSLTRGKKFHSQTFNCAISPLPAPPRQRGGRPLPPVDGGTNGGRYLETVSKLMVWE